MATLDSGLRLDQNDPDPVAWLRKDSRSPLLLVCEHAGRAIPRALGDLGVPQSIIDSHRGWDIGAADLARRLSDSLDAPLLLQRYSRLVIDCNRPPEGRHAVLDVSDGVSIPANQGLSDEQQWARSRAIFAPYDAAIADGFARHPRRVALAIHSFTRTIGGQERPWHAGFLARRDRETPKRLYNEIAAKAQDLVLAINQPYQVDEETDWFIPAHAERRGLAHCLIEVRNDGLLTPGDIDRWATLLTEAINSLPELEP